MALSSVTGFVGTIHATVELGTHFVTWTRKESDLTVANRNLAEAKKFLLTLHDLMNSDASATLSRDQHDVLHILTDQLLQLTLEWQKLDKQSRAGSFWYRIRPNNGNLKQQILSLRQSTASLSNRAERLSEQKLADGLKSICSRFGPRMVTSDTSQSLYLNRNRSTSSVSSTGSWLGINTNSIPLVQLITKTKDSDRQTSHPTITTEVTAGGSSTEGTPTSPEPSNESESGPSDIIEADITESPSPSNPYAVDILTSPSSEPS